VFKLLVSDIPLESYSASFCIAKIVLGVLTWPFLTHGIG